MVLTPTGSYHTYEGATVVAAGTLKLGSANALGSTAGGTSITAGAVLDLNGQTISNAEALTVRGTGISSGGAVINSSTTGASYAGLITLGAASSIVGGAGTISLTHSGTITGSTYGLTLGGASGGSIASIIGTGTGTLTKADAGTWSLTGVNTYTGNTTINDGTLAISGSGKIYSTVGGSGPVITVNSGAILSITDWAYGGSFGTLFYDKTALVINGGTLKYAGSSNTMDYNNGARGFTVGSSGATFETVTSGVTWNLYRDSTVGYQAAFNGNVTFTGAGNGAIQQIISGSNALTKAGAGTWTLSGANSYTGGTTISGGILSISSDANLGAVPGSVTTNSMTCLS